MMKFGVNMWVWVSPTTLDDLIEYAPKIKAMGFDMLEVGVEGVDDLDYAGAKQVLADHGLGISLAAAMGPDRDLIHDDSGIQENGARYIRQCIDAAHTLGAEILCGPIYAAVGRTWEQTPEGRKRDSERLVKHLTDLANYGQDHGVTLCIEPLNRFETSFLNTAEQAMAIMNRVDHPNCKVHLDSFHMNIEEKSLGAAIRLCGDKLGHFHACENDRGAPGSGNVTWDDTFSALKAINYNGSIVIESFTNKVKTIARAAAIWRAFEPSQDALAENGLRFLKQSWWKDA
jgi:D-psicose/D-tagatose/L-ribulose 3-epimerase